jgi:hypothetical protein
MWINGEIKALNETKSGAYYSKNGYDYSDGGYNRSNYDVNETQIRPWMSWNTGKHNFFFKMEIGPETGTNPDGTIGYESDDVKLIVAHSYPIKQNLYFLSEVSYRHRTNKEAGGVEYGDADVYFGKIGLNYIF